MEISKEFIKLIMDCELLRRCGEKMILDLMLSMSILKQKQKNDQ